MDRQRNALFGLVALQHGKVTPERLVAAADQTSGDLAQDLVDSGVLASEDRDTLDRILDGIVREHGGDIAATIASLGIDPAAAASAAESILRDEEPLKTVLTDPRLRSGGETSRAGAPMDTARTVLADPAQLQAKLDTMGAARAKPGTLVPAVEEHPGRYAPLREFAKGGMGKILLVRDTHLGRDIALKQLLPQHIPGGTRTGAPTIELLTVPIIARFLQEARVTGQLEHPSIVPVYELGYREDGSLYYTMKFVRGRSLQDALKDAPEIKDRLPFLTHFLDLCQAIAYAHDRGVIHRDLKPLNVMIGEFGETVVIDWGIAKVKGHQDLHASDLRGSVQTLQIGETEATAKTLYGQTIGSPYYMPPEQAAGRVDEIDERSDVYALGAVLYTILTGQPPYSGSKVKDFLSKVEHFPPKPVRELEPDAPPELAAICDRALARNPADRYPSAKELRDEVEKYLSGGLVSAYEYRFSELLRRFIKRHRTVLTTSAIAAVLLIALGVFSYVRVTYQRNRAVAAEQVASEERDNAVRQEQIAVAARNQAQRELYFADVALVQRAIQEQQMASARDRLEKSPAAYRDWEWGYLECLSNADLMTLRAGGRYAAFAQNGAALITGGAGGTVALQDLRAGNTIRTFIDKAGFGYALAASRDGARVAVSTERAVLVWDSASGDEIFRFEEPAAALNRNHVAISNDGSRMAALNTDRTARIWDIGRKEVLLSLPVRQAQGFEVYFSPSGDQILVISSEFGSEGWLCSFELLRLPSGESLGKGQLAYPLTAHAAAFSPDGALFALGTDEGLQVWEIAGWTKRYTLDMRFKYPDTIAFSPDSTRIGAGSLDGDLAIWDARADKGTRVSKGHQDAVRAVAFSHDGRRLATAGFDRTVRLWETPSLRPLHTYRGHDKALFTVAFSPDDLRLATGSFDGRTKLWDLSAEVEFAPVERMVFHAGRGILAGSMGAQAGIWESHSGHRLQTIEGLNPPVKALAFDPAGAVLAIAVNESGKDVIGLWDTATGAKRGAIAMDTAGTTEIAFGDSGRCLAVRSGTTVSLRDTPSGEELLSIPKTAAFLFDPAGKRLATASAESAGAKECTIAIWDVAQRQQQNTYVIKTNYFARLAFTPDGARLFAGAQVAAEDGSLQGLAYSWNLAEGTAGPTLEGHKGQVSCLAFSADGALLATGSHDDTMILWDTAAGAQKLQLTGHSDNILALAFSPDARRLVSASQDGTFKLWDTQDGREILTLQASALEAEGQSVAPEQCAFSPDARQLVTLTQPVVPPIVLHAFPWNDTAYPEGASLQDRVEIYKRAYWRAGGS